ncbi:MAG: CAP domain-containing protein [Ruminococcus sp.]|nr:CAP domain-containing protein [Ruminococcus sp.]MCM1381346.1 CAP domain-containing protein [Muribaculaceae bacterium]MCM1480603.1 CAP domain-containing protein [Muribaculaceae bacterium]
MNNLLRTLICAALAAAMAISLAAADVSAAKVKLNRTSADVPIGYSVTVKLTGASKAEWSSSDESVAAVKADGASAKITGKKAGTATVSAKVGSTTLKCAVTVKKSFITASPQEVSAAKGKTKTVTLKVTGAKDIALSNSDKSVCSTSWGKWDGNNIKLTIKAKKKGTAVITVYAKGSQKSTAEKITVTVGGNEMLTPEEQVVELVNKERKAKGLNELEMDEELNRIAAIKAKEISEQYTHDRPDGRSWRTLLDDEGYSFSTAAENINRTSIFDVEYTMDSWMNSETHKKNILTKGFTKIGIGYYEGADGKFYWVQEFVS